MGRHLTAANSQDAELRFIESDIKRSAIMGPRLRFSSLVRGLFYCWRNATPQLKSRETYAAVPPVVTPLAWETGPTGF